MSATRNRKLLGQLLIERRVITEEQLQQALQQKERTGRLLGEVLIELGFVTSDQLGQILRDMVGADYIDLSAVEIDPEALAVLPQDFQRQHGVLPYRLDGSRLYVAMRDPLDIKTIDRINLMSGRDIFPMFAPMPEIQKAFQRLFTLNNAVRSVLLEMEEDYQKDYAEDTELSAIQLEMLAEDAPIIRLVNTIIAEAISARASDIHIEPREHLVRVRYRIDGVLYDQMEFPRSYHAAVISRLKIMSRLDIAERRRPQDGRIAFSESGDREYDLRLSLIPMLFGEKAVMRILDKKGMLIPLEQLGLYPEQLQVFQPMFRSPHGIVLITGPTGSGKTTTLYAVLNAIDDGQRNISTIEDPIEYQLDGINQSQVNAKIGYTFAEGLRSFMRQDPDVIMVGEIRDPETAETAVQASLTGHLVLSTLHTNNAPEGMVRLDNIGVEPYLIASSVIGIVAQRLLRRVCSVCSAPVKPDPDLLKAFGISPSEASGGDFRKGQGCAQCNGRGYRGRVAVFEVMPVTPRLREAILTRSSGEALRNIALEEGMMPLFEAGLRQAWGGVSTLEEVERVLPKEHTASVLRRILRAA
jgi:type IV pilus assembly protein PilB